MTKPELLELMITLLNQALAEEDIALEVDATMPLLGGESQIGSLTLVSFVSDLETIVSEKSGYDELTFVSEEALSRKKSPFRNIDVFADYILELLEAH